MLTEDTEARAWILRLAARLPDGDPVRDEALRWLAERGGHLCKDGVVKVQKGRTICSSAR